MGVTLTDLSIDDSYSAEVIQKAMHLSPEIDEYVTTEQYLLETDEDNLTPAWLRNKLMTIVLEQLSASGIKINMPESTMLDDPLMVHDILLVREKFDHDYLFELFKDHKDIADFVREVTDDSDCIGDIIAYCASIFGRNESWEMLGDLLKQKSGVIESTDVFVDVLNQALDRLDRLGDPGLIDASNEGLVTAYVRFLGKRKRDITTIAKTIYSTKVSVESNEIAKVDAKEVAVDGFMQTFEKELVRPSVISGLDPSKDVVDIGPVRASFVPKWQHTLEYWLLDENLGKIPSELTFAVMIATMYEDFGANSEARAKIIGRFEENIDTLGSRYERFRDMLDNALANLVTFQESEVM